MRNLSRSKEAPCAEKLLADLLPYIGTPIASAISERYGKRVSALCEIRFVLQRPVTVEFSDGFEVLSDRNARPVIADFECVNRVVNAVSDGSLYSINETIKDGFVTIEGGHRIGFCGHAAHMTAERSATLRIFPPCACAFAVRFWGAQSV